MWRRAVLLALTAILVSACTSDPQRPPPKTSSRSASDTVVIGPALVEVPREWSFSVSRQVGDSWSFALAARHSFNLGRFCAHDTGSLGPLLRFEKAFVFGSAHRGELPDNDPARQVPGELRLDPATLGPYEGTGCRPTYRMTFDIDGFYFIVHVALHGDPRPALRREVIAVLNTLTES